MATNHECAGCGGSGLGIKLLGIPCDICLGSGRISDLMPVADLRADAETLRLARAYYWPDYSTGRIDALDYVTAGNMLAERMGRLADFQGRMR